MDSLLELIKRPFLDLASDLLGAVLYLDKGSAEAVQVGVGLPFLFGLGAANVCDLASPSPEDSCLQAIEGNSTITTLAFFITQLLHDASNQITAACMVHPNATRLIIFSSLSEQAHAIYTTLGAEAFRDGATQLKEDVLKAYEQKQVAAPNLAVTVRSFPLHICALTPTAFALPVQSASNSRSRITGLPAGFLASELSGSDDSSPSAGLLSHTLAGLVSQLGASKVEAYALGPVSQIIAQELSSLPLPVYPTASTSSASQAVGVILLDRSLDLATPCLHGEHLLDCIFEQSTRQDDQTTSMHPRSVDVRVDVPGLCPFMSALRDTSDQQGSSQPSVFGCELFSPEDKTAASRIEQLVAKKPKEAAQALRKWLKQALSQEKLTPAVRSKAGAVPPSELQALAETLAAAPGSGLRHRSIITLASAAAAALSGPGADGWEAAAAFERQLISMMAASGGSEVGTELASSLVDALQQVQHRKGPLRLAHIVQILCTIFAVCSDNSPSAVPFEPEEEQRLQDALLSALCSADEGDLQAVGMAPGTLQSKADLKKQISQFFARLHATAGSRRKLKDLQKLVTADVFAESAATVNPLLRQVVRKILQRADITDFSQATQPLVGGFLTRSLGRLAGLQSRPQVQPHELQQLLVFVVGGISMAEIREVRQEIDEFVGDKPTVLLGGSSLLSPSDVSRILFAS